LPFRIEFAELAAEKFRKLDQTLQERIASRLRLVSANPRRYVSSLRNIRAFKVRVGDYRLIVDIDWSDEVICVLTLGHRSTVYRR